MISYAKEHDEMANRCNEAGNGIEFDQETNLQALRAGLLTNRGPNNGNADRSGVEGVER